ncbi:MAG: hypothetical protein JW983_03660 [Elusimicrobia bacterium]|nr:hypothetical protein [Elusimicrobiota bacterium]
MNSKNKKTLQAVIFEYIKTSRPVGSKNLSRKYGYASSSIRNWMSQLERGGYLKNVHTSSGRIPTDKGWRFYIDELLSTQQSILNKRDQLKREYNEEIKKQNAVLAELSKVFFYILKNSDYNLSPKPEKAVFKELILTLINKKTVFGIVFSSFGAVKDFIIKTDKPVSQKFLDKAADLITKILKGVAFSRINDSLTEQIGSFDTDCKQGLDFLQQNLDKLFKIDVNNFESEDMEIASKIEKTAMEIDGLGFERRK